MLTTFKRHAKRALAVGLGNAPAYLLSERAMNARNFPYVKAVTYHDTPSRLRDNLSQHFEWYRSRFVDCGPSDLEALVTHGVWPHDRPGILVTFDDGLRSNYEVAAPLLDEYGLTGWFMIPAAVPTLERAEEAPFVRDRLIQTAPPLEGRRTFMSWDEVRDLDRHGHQIVCHSYGHKRLGVGLTADEIEEEVAGSRALMEANLGHPVRSFAWVGGEEYAFSKKAYDRIRSAGYDFLFSTNCLPITACQSPFKLERYHVDAAFGLDEVRLATGGLYDMLYGPKRRRVDRTLEGRT